MSRDGCIALVNTTAGQVLAYANDGRWWLAPGKEAILVNNDMITVSQTCLLVARRPRALQANIGAVEDTRETDIA